MVENLGSTEKCREENLPSAVPIWQYTPLHDMLIKYCTFSPKYLSLL